jgi:hypothetical protein
MVRVHLDPPWFLAVLHDHQPHLRMRLIILQGMSCLRAAQVDIVQRDNISIAGCAEYGATGVARPEGDIVSKSSTLAGALLRKRDARRESTCY